MKKEKAPKVKDFNARYHNIGRIFMLISILIFFGVPITICVYYKVMPDWAVFADTGIITLLIINLGSCIAEPVLYAPMLGTNGEYLAFITGNLSNLKIPCVVRAHEIYPEPKRGTEEYELISTITVATSTLVTTVIIGVFVMVLALSQDFVTTITTNEWITPAFTCVVYALFGSLGGKYVVKNPKLAIIPLIIVVVISVVLGFLGINPGSVYLVVGIVVCLLFAIWQVLNERRKVKEKNELERLSIIASSNIGFDFKVEDEEDDEATENLEEVKSDEPSESIEEQVVEEVTEAIIDSAEEVIENKEEIE